MYLRHSVGETNKWAIKHGFMWQAEEQTLENVVRKSRRQRGVVGQPGTEVEA